MEEWRNIQDYEGLYQVSNWARVKSVERDVIYYVNGKQIVRHHKERILSQRPNYKGYLIVKLWKDGVRHTKGVHQLVAQAFLPNPNNYDTVHHKNHDQTDNRIENLMWIDGHEHDAMHAAEHAELFGKTVYQYKDGELVAVWPSTHEAARQLGFKRTNISACCNGGHPDKSRPSGWHKAETYKGYKWSYEPL